MQFDLPVQQPTATSISLTVEHGNLTLVATLPEVFAALAEVLPIASKLFGSKKHMLVNSRDMHKALGIVRDHSTWLSGVWKQYDLVEGVDFFVERLDKHDMSNWPAIKANGGKVPTVYLFPPKLAARIATLTKTEMGQKIWDYMYAVTDAAHDTVEAYYQRELVQKDKAIADKTRAHNHAASEAEMLAGQLGCRSRTEAVAKVAFDLKAAEKKEHETTVSAKGIQAESLAFLVESSCKDLLKAKSLERVKAITEGTIFALGEIQSGNLNVRTWY